ncbi:MAG: FHA domain-containing protein [Oscillospiraceae bacterium]|nr:FHA domain-containing protein [Oscillospiraceae bacterium]
MAVLVLLLTSDVCHIHASDYSRYIYSYVENNDINIFVDLTEDASADECSIGGAEAQILKSGRISDNTAVNTVILIDAYAVSSAQQGSDIVSDILSGILCRSLKNEQYSLLVFSDGVLKTIESSTTNQLNLLNSVKAAQYSANYPSDMNDCVKMAQTYLDQQKFSGINRIVLLTNSAEVDKLNSTEDSMSYPLYVITDSDISVNKEPSANKSFVEIFQYDEAAADSGFNLNQTDNIYYIKARIPDNLGQGRKEISVSFSGKDKNVYIKAPVNIDTVVRQDANMDFNRKTVFAAVILSVIAVISSAVIIFRHMRTKKYNDDSSVHTSGLPRIPQDLFNRIISSRTTQIVKKQSGITVLLSYDGKSDIVFELTENRGYILGRSSTLSDIKIEYDKSISQKHCRIYLKNNEVYVTDLGSLNHTYVDGVRVKTELKLADKSKLRLGRADFTVSIK